MMRYTKNITVRLILAGFVLTTTGACQPLTHPTTIPGEVGALFEEVGAMLSLNKKQIRIGVTHTEIDWLKPMPWAKLQQDMGKKLGRPMLFRPLYPFQAQMQLALGRIDFAMVSAGDYVTDLSDENLVEVLALPVGANGNVQRRGVILASAKSDIQKISDLTGKRFAFGPHGDAILHFAAIAALRDNGVSLDDIQRETIPIPGSLQFHISGLEAAKAAVYESGTFACVVDEEEYNRWADTGGSLIPLKITKDQVRVIGHTPYMPVGVILARKNADPDLVKEVREYLLSEDEAKKATLADLGWSDFQPPDEKKLAWAKKLAAMAMDSTLVFGEEEEGLPPPDDSVLEENH